MKWSNYLTLVENWMNKVRSEVTEMMPWEIIKGETPEQLIEQIIKFPKQPEKEGKDEIIQIVATRIKNKALKTENKKTKSKKN